MPPDDATPEDVVKAYVEAVHEGDCDTADALSESPPDNWCGSSDLTGLKITDITQEPRQTETGEGPQIERVWVEFDLVRSDGSMPEGRTMWSYLLDRTGPNGAWRIYDQGLG